MPPVFFILIPELSPLIHFCSVLILFLPFHVTYGPQPSFYNTNIHAPGGIRTHDPSKRAAEDPRLRPHGHWDRQELKFLHWLLTLASFCLKLNPREHYD
jgi:hypothetical protein